MSRHMRRANQTFSYNISNKMAIGSVLQRHKLNKNFTREMKKRNQKRILLRNVFYQTLKNVIIMLRDKVTGLDCLRHGRSKNLDHQTPNVKTIRRGYAVASQLGATTTVKGGVKIMSNVVAKKQTGESVTASSWVPDPKTGHYRPENRADEIDVAELRQMSLKQRNYNKMLNK